MMVLRNILLIAANVAMLACSRPEGETSDLQISLPTQMSKVGTMGIDANYSLAHVVVNITGSDLRQPLLYTFDACSDCFGGPRTIPNPLPIGDVPTSGMERLIQTLAVYKHSSSGEMVFYYGGIPKVLALATEDVSMALEKMGAASSPISGRVSGRYMTAVDAGPTSLVDIKLDPGKAGHPALIVEKGAIVNGWFSFFAMSGVQFSYVLRSTGEVLWGKAVSLDSDVFDPGANSGSELYHLVKAYIPAHTSYESNSNGNQYFNREPSIYAWGYWGTGASLKKVCSYSLPASTSKIKVYDLPANYGSASYLTISRLLSYDDPTPTNAELLDTVTPFTSLVIKGGSTMTGSCGAFTDNNTNQYLNFQKIQIGMVDGNGNDRAAGFTGIYRADSSGNALTPSGDPVVVSGQLLPGVVDIFSQLKIYKRVGSEELRIKEADCNALSLAQFGFQPAAISGSIAADGTFSLTSDISSADATNSGVSAVFCPVTSGGFVSPIGHFFSKWDFGYNP